MWPELQELRIYIDTTEILLEIAIRVAVLLMTLILQIGIKPHMAPITKIDLLKNYKYPRRESYVPPSVTVFVVIVVPLLFFAVPVYTNKNYVDASQSFLAWTLALSVNALATEILKLATGRPRPDYFYRCFPDGIMTRGINCTGDLKDVWEGRKSFPSGHSSFAFSSMGFLSLWLCGKLSVMSRPRRRVEHTMCCVAPLSVAAVVAVSRWCDNHHHWEDVLAGSLLGLLFAYVSYTRYYHPLESDMAGCPYLITENRARDNRSQSMS